MGHCSEFSNALWATDMNLVMCYRPLRQIWFWATSHCSRFVYTLCEMKPDSKICNNFLTMGSSAGIDYALWGHGAGFSYVLWAIVLNQLPERNST
jgi:hypothetical protein